jgi:hypothetical protein
MDRTRLDEHKLNNSLQSLLLLAAPAGLLGLLAWIIGGGGFVVFALVVVLFLQLVPATPPPPKSVSVSTSTLPWTADAPAHGAYAAGRGPEPEVSPDKWYAEQCVDCSIAEAAPWRPLGAPAFQPARRRRGSRVEPEPRHPIRLGVRQRRP